MQAACRLIEYPEIIATRIECRTFIALMFVFALALDASYIAPTCKQAPFQVWWLWALDKPARALTQTQHNLINIEQPICQPCRIAFVTQPYRIACGCKCVRKGRTCMPIDWSHSPSPYICNCMWHVNILEIMMWASRHAWHETITCKCACRSWVNKDVGKRYVANVSCEKPATHAWECMACEMTCGRHRAYQHVLSRECVREACIRVRGFLPSTSSPSKGCCEDNAYIDLCAVRILLKVAYWP